MYNTIRNKVIGKLISPSRVDKATGMIERRSRWKRPVTGEVAHWMFRNVVMSRLSLLFFIKQWRVTFSSIW